MSNSREELVWRIEEFLEGYKRWLKLGFSPATVNTYLSVVKQYISYYGTIPPSEEPMVDVEIAIEFIEKYGSTLRSKSVAAYAIKNLYEYLGRPDIASRIVAPRGTGWSPEAIPVDYVTLKKAIALMPGKRDRAMLCVAYELALRRKEVKLLKRSEFNPNTCQVIVYRVKRPKGIPEMVGPMQLSKWCCELVRDYLKSRNDDVDALFVAGVENPRPVSEVTIWRAFKKLANILGMSELRLHQLRHTRLTELAEQTPDVLALAKFAGHRNPQSTMIYVHLSGVRAQKRLEKSEDESEEEE